MAPFDAAYGALSSSAAKACTDAMFTTTASSPAASCARHALLIRNTDFTLIANTRSHSSSVTSEIPVENGLIPAMLHRTLSRPRRAATSATDSQSTPWLTSAVHAVARRPASRSSAAVRSAASATRSTHTTCAPSAASRAAVARPIPWPAPVTIATSTSPSAPDPPVTPAPRRRAALAGP